MVENRLQNRDRKESVVYGHDLEVLEWMRKHESFASTGPATALGVARNGKLIAGFAFFNYRWPDIEIGIVSVSPRWANVLDEISLYPFKQLNCNRVTACVSASDPRIRRLLEKLGFVYEGTKRKALESGDVAVYGLLKEDWFK